MKKAIKYLVMFILSFIEGWCLYFCTIYTNDNIYAIIGTILLFSLIITFLID